MDSNHRSPVKDRLVETVLFDFPAEARKRTPSAVGDLNRAIWAAISAGTITSATTTTASAGDGGALKTAALLTGDRWFESCSLQRRVLQTIVPSREIRVTPEHSGASHEGWPNHRYLPASSHRTREGSLLPS